MGFFCAPSECRCSRSGIFICLLCGTDKINDHFQRGLGRSRTEEEPKMRTKTEQSQFTHAKVEAISTHKEGDVQELKKKKE